jgi:hypothetical protein
LTVGCQCSGCTFRSIRQLRNSLRSLISSTMYDFMQAVSSFLAQTLQFQTPLKTRQKRQLECWRALCMRRWLYHEANIRRVCLCCRPVCSVHAQAPRLDPSTLFKVLIWTAWRLPRTSFNCQSNVAFLLSWDYHSHFLQNVECRR